MSGEQLGSWSKTLKILYYWLAVFAQLHASVDLDVNCYAVMTGLLPSMLRNITSLHFTFISGEVLVHKILSAL